MVIAKDTALNETEFTLTLAESDIDETVNEPPIAKDDGLSTEIFLTLKMLVIAIR
ncbi:hypothetical protein [Psychromonas sp. Urea-02u-13]|uniref:hypothetical protein n=1 Tax=Psychromonas sp. Urea-02u-13 TaxID=2058326 RepID=UPI0012FF1707|nr:hypothetical protein [Psychromonas sp. Urea-02u-13]